MAIPTPSIDSIYEASSFTSFIITTSLFSSEQDTLYLYKGTSDNPTDLYASYSVSQDNWLKFVYVTNNIGNTKYYYRARCSYNGTYGNYSSTVSSITAPSAVYASLLNNTKTSATFSISCSSSGSALTTHLKYSIKVAGGTESVVDTGLTDTQGSTITYTINNLSPSSNYVVTFYLENDSGKGMSNTVTFSTSTFYGPKSGYQTSSVARSNFTLSDTSNMGLYSKLSSSSSLNVRMYGDTSQTTYSGKNLLGLPNGSATGGGITSQTSEGFISITGTPTGNYIPIITTNTQLKKAIPAGNYTFSINQTLPFTLLVTLATEDNTQTWFIIAEGARSITRELSAEVTKITAWSQSGIEVGTALNITNLGFQLESGSSATSFEPYVGSTESPNPDYPQEVQTVTGLQTIDITGSNGESQEYEINLGKNLFDKDNASTISAYIESSGSHGIVNDSYSTCVWIPCETNTTYTISRTAGNVFRAVTTSQTPTTGVTTTNYVGNDTGSNITISTGTSGKYLVIEVRNYNSASTLAEILASLQIEKGSTATSYAPYFTPIELCKIGSYQDYIYKSDGNWYLHKVIQKLTLDGSEAWQKISGLGWNAYFYASLFGTYPENAVNIISDKYLGIARNNVSANNKTICFSGNGNVRIDNNDYASVSDLTNALSSNNVTAYYWLATPTDTQITDEALLEQLNKFYLLAHAYPESTTFSTRGDLPILLNGNFPYTDGNDTSEKIVRMYGSVDGKTKRVKKLYGSVNGKTKLILNNS